MATRCGRVLVLVIVAVWAAGARAQRPHFDPRSDYAYDLAATDVEVRVVGIDESGFRWPAGDPGGDTALLEFNLTAEPGVEPVVVAERGGERVSQAFERDSLGRRFLDVSPLLGAGGEVVRLSGTGARWGAGAARLFVYRNRPLAGRRVLVLAPHPDDAEIAAFGVYRQAGAVVITVTSGDAGGKNFGVLFEEPGEHYRVKGWIRTWDSISVPFYGGVPPDRARNLGYYDALLRPMQRDPAAPVAPLIAKLDEPGYYRRFNVDPALRDRPFTPTWNALVADLVWELERVRPEVIVTAHPMLDNHPDHQFATIALIEALARWPGECEVYLYTNHATENEAWPLGDRQAISGLPPTSRGALHFRRIHSVPLSAEDQKLKLVALEAMHDLREFDLRESLPPPMTEAMHERRKRHDYFRRGPRPNELFFVAGREDVARLREEFLRGR